MVKMREKFLSKVYYDFKNSFSVKACIKDFGLFMAIKPYVERLFTAGTISVIILMLSSYIIEIHRQHLLLMQLELKRCEHAQVWPNDYLR